MKLPEYNDSLIRPRGNYFALLVLGLALCCPLAIYFLNPVATAYVSDGFLQLSPLWIPLAGLGAVLALTGLVYMVRMIAYLPPEGVNKGVEKVKEARAAVAEAEAAARAAVAVAEAERAAHFAALNWARCAEALESKLLAEAVEAAAAAEAAEAEAAVAEAAVVEAAVAVAEAEAAAAVAEEAEAAAASQLKVVEERFKLNNRKLGLYILKHIVLYTLVGGGLAGVIGWLAAGGNLAGVFGVVGPDAVYVNIAFVIGLSLLAWKFLAWGSDHTSRIFTMKLLQYRKGVTRVWEEQFLLNNDGLLTAWGENKLFRKAAWKDNLVMLLWAGYLATIPYLAHTIHWFNSDLATGGILVSFAVIAQLIMLSFNRNVGNGAGHKSHYTSILIQGLFYYAALIVCALFPAGVAGGGLMRNYLALAMVIFPSILLGLLLVKFLASAVLASNLHRRGDCVMIIVFICFPISIPVFAIVWVFNLLFAPFALRNAYSLGYDCPIVMAANNTVARGPSVDGDNKDETLSREEQPPTTRCG